MWNPDQPFNDLPHLPPGCEIESKAVLRGCVGARAAVAALKQAALLIPNQSMLITTLPLLEAQASSEIENIVTTTDRLFRFAPADREALADPATKEALRYRTALRRGVEFLKTRPLATAIAVDVCRTLRAVNVDVRGVPGTARPWLRG